MLSIDSVVGYGYVLQSHELTYEQTHSNNPNLIRMCCTCPNTNWFLGKVIYRANSAQQYKKISNFDNPQIHMLYLEQVCQMYRDMFGKEPPTGVPDLILFTQTQKLS